MAIGCEGPALLLKRARGLYSAIKMYEMSSLMRLFPIKESDSLQWIVLDALWFNIF